MEKRLDSAKRVSMEQPVSHQSRRFEMNNNPGATLAGAILSRRAVWAEYAACTWAFAFAAMSFYWAAGGTVGGETIGPAIMSQAHEPMFIAILWITGTMKLFGGLIALALVQSWGRLLPRWLPLAAAWVGVEGRYCTAAPASSSTCLWPLAPSASPPD
jgi:hypothetical protein